MRALTAHAHSPGVIFKDWGDGAYVGSLSGIVSGNMLLLFKKAFFPGKLSSGVFFWCLAGDSAPVYTIICFNQRRTKSFILIALNTCVGMRDASQHYDGQVDPLATVSI